MPRFISDIDGTVLDRGQPVQAVIEFIDEYAEELVFLTNRPESDRERTVKDLEATGLEYQQLIMNGGEDPAPVFKAKVIQGMLDAGEPVDLFIDNDEANRNAVEALGVEVIDPADIISGESDFSLRAIGANTMDAIKTNTPEAKLKAAEATVSAAISERDSLRADFEALTAKNLELSAAAEKVAAESSAKVEALTKELAEVTARAAAAESLVAELQAKAESVATVAAKELAAIGLEQPLPVTGSAAQGQDTRSILEQYAALADKPAERAAFFAANKRAIFAARAQS